MSPRRNRNGTAPTLIAFGKRLRRFREANNWTQEALAVRAYNGAGVKPQYIGMIENGRTKCTEKFAQSMDQLLGANGELVGLWHDLVEDAGYPVWFDWPGIEEDAVSIHAFELGVVTGLLQSRPYAATILKGNEEAIEGRMRRQRILTREEPPPPEVAVLLDKSVLYRDVGGHEVMRGQLEHLVDSVSDRLIVQIVPQRFHTGISGSFTLATMEDRSQVGYAETVARGVTMSDEADLARMAEALSSLRAHALPVDMSIDLIRKVVAENWM
ncbi:helix-turn-helix domain-containing protein [Actinomadura macrotermitis]|uniref:HTH cro/C1-type domain-containing protein n=1 Tax=Actinomadura macrotermitis TaxID=2585200 RepID=A0A7K0BN71_9ACTN|nr:helix-turn-helix transcriptional regulator [Actinomadura macrotermitis]MQY02630.1 hypothetical protein [Actinomadura macrotermitis]